MSLVLFDIDGTLLSRAGPHHRAALCTGIKRVTGLQTTLDGVDTSGMLDRDLLTAMLRTAGVSSSVIRSSLRRIMVATEAAYQDDCAKDLRDRVCEGVRETLTELRRCSSLMGVVSGNLTGIGWRKLELAGLREFFSFGAFAEDGRTRTRLARVAFWRARKTGLPRDAKVSLIGDHFNDIEAAKRNDFQAIAVATGLTPLEQLALAEPDIAVPNLTHLDVGRLL